MKKSCFFIVFLILISVMFSGCYDAREIDDMAYAMALGIDKGKTNNVKLTLQFVSPAGGGGEEDKEKGGSSGSVLTTIEAPSIHTGLDMVNNYISKEVNLSHAKVIVFSKEIAQEGLDKYVNAMMRAREFRGTMYMAVTRSSAEEFIKAVKPKLQSNTSRFFEAFFKTYYYTGFSINSQLSDFIIEGTSLAMQPVTALVGLGNYKSSEEFQADRSTSIQKGNPYPQGGDFKAGDIPKTFDVQAETMGLAVFNGGKMIGELDGEESVMYLMSIGKYNSSYMSIEDPQSKGDLVVLEVRQSRKPVNKVDISGRNPKISSRIKLEADIVSIQSGINYEKPENTHIIETAMEEHIKSEMLGYLNKTSKEFNSDICGFGNEVKKKFLTWQEWSNYKWLDRYKNASFDVGVDLKVRRPGLIVRTQPIYSVDK